MFEALIQFLVGLAEKLGLQWLQNHKEQKANNAENNVKAMSDSELDRRVLDDITRSE